MVKTSNSACRRYVEKCLPFIGSNLAAVWVSQRYIVYSYGPHWPLFIYEQVTDTWYANSDKFSRSTSRHYSQAHPLVEMVMLSVEDMKAVVRGGSVGLIEAANERMETV
jgi:hypothetical protein